MWSCEEILGLFRVVSIHIANRLTMTPLVPQTRSSRLFLDRAFMMFGDLGPKTLQQHGFKSEKVVVGMFRVLSQQTVTCT